ncbi:MAG: hypothetical protein WB679_09460 [Terracidiphilus sp.]
MHVGLGLFHFNPHWGADSRSAYRHCSESLGPFLRALCERPYWRVDLEISGSGLEFVHKSFPEQGRLIHILVDRGQIELISALYTPSIWVAFPRRDLERSIEMNRECLKALGLPITRIFFAQEAFFGAGVSALCKHFDLAVCKDDYLAYLYDLDYSQPLFNLNGMPVLVASGHILNELTRRMRAEPEFAERHRLPFSLLHQLAEANSLNRESKFPAVAGTWRGVTWRWYHCGDGNHFGCIHKPDDLTRCYYDSTWSALVISEIDRLREDGVEFHTISEFAAMVSPPERPLPALIEGAWNAAKAVGVSCWMGRNATESENDAVVLSAASRARRRVVEAETLLATMDGELSQLRQKLKLAWVAVLNSQISDTLGWTARAVAVSFSLRSSDQALVLGSQIIEEARGRYFEDPMINGAADTLHTWSRPTYCVEFFGGQGESFGGQCEPGVDLWECDFISSEEYCGVRIPFELDHIVYCPSGMESTPFRISLEELKPDIIALPLANGLLQLSNDLFVIKDTAHVHVAALVSKSARTMEFAVFGSPKGQRYTWRLYFISGGIERAVNYANTINKV